MRFIKNLTYFLHLLQLYSRWFKLR